MADGLFDFPHDEKYRIRLLAYHSIGQVFTYIFLLSPVGFGSLLITNSVFALQWICLLLAGLQILVWFWKPITPVGSGNKPVEVLKKRLNVLVQSGGFVFAGVLFYYLVSVLYGAPFTESTAETFHFSLLLSLLTTLPACLLVGPNLSSWTNILISKGPESTVDRHVYWTTLAAIFGAWVGCFPIPLDWDRPWQAWPITCCVGALLGSAAGNLISALQILTESGKNIHLSTKKRKHV